MYFETDNTFGVVLYSDEFSRWHIRIKFNFVYVPDSGQHTKWTISLTTTAWNWLKRDHLLVVCTVKPFGILSALTRGTTFGEPLCGSLNNNKEAP